ncbi:unnamed protein product [Sphagnum balticum]
MAQLKIPLAPNESTLRKEDLSRAMFCALAISQEDYVKEVEDKLKQHPDLQFEEIHISVPNLDGEPIQKFVVASAEDIIFIAFQGMVTPTDFIISDLQFDEQLGDDYLPKCLESMISIAFGAPPLCDAKAAKLVNDNPDFKWRFVNFVNQPDFVPCVLQRYQPDSAELQNFLRDISMSNTTNTEAVNEQHPSGQCTYPNQQDSRFRVAIGYGAKDLASNLRQRTNMSRTAINISDVSANSRDSITVTPDIKGGAEFHPIGQYIFVNQNGKNDVRRVDGSSAEMSELLKISQFDRAAWERHKAARYKEALTGSEDSAQPQPLTTVVKRPLPEVEYANFRSTDAGSCFLKIRGKNLLFLCEPVSLNGRPCVPILRQTQNDLWVSEPKEFSKQGARQAANYMVIIKTAFGQASRLVTEDFVEESGTTAAVNLLPKIWQCMLVMAQPPLRVLPKTDDLNTLDEIIQCAFEQEVETKLSCCLRSIADGEDPSNHVQEADKFIKDDVLKNFLTSSLCISYETQTYVPEICAATGGFAIAGLACAATLTAVTGGLGLGVVAGVVILVAVASATEKIWNCVPTRYIDSYKEVLQLAIREAKAWNSSAVKSDEATTSKKQEINEEELERQEGNPRDKAVKGHTRHRFKPSYDDSIWLVDFPGGNGTEDYVHQWQFFTALPSIVVLFLDFKDKLKAEQKEMYEHLKKDMKTKVLIAFNKVDERYTPRNRSLYVAE